MKVQELFEATEPVKKEKPWDGSDFAGKKLTYKSWPAALAKVPSLVASKPGGRGFTVAKGVSYTTTQWKKLISNLQSAVTDGTWIRDWSSPRKPKQIFIDWDEEDYGTKATVMFDSLNWKDFKGRLGDMEKIHDEQMTQAMSKSKGTGGGKGYFLKTSTLKSDYIFAIIDEGPHKGEPVGFPSETNKQFKKGDTIYVNYGSTYGSVSLNKKKMS